LASSYQRGGTFRIIAWLYESNETTNFTYNLSERNIKHLVGFVAHITQRPYDEINRYVNEILGDQELQNHVVNHTKAYGAADSGADIIPKYARRIGWYAFVRALKPNVIIETGVEKGLGTVVLAAAVKKNTEEGGGGHVYGTDINQSAGWLLQPPYSQFATILYGDSIASLKSFDQAVDLFINDSDHSSDYEAQEYRVIKSKLAPHALILGDNAHCSDALMDFAKENGFDFLFFSEEPKNHWYPGGGIGVAVL